MCRRLHFVTGTATTTPIVALVIPCFNDGEYLTAAVASLDERISVEQVIRDNGARDVLIRSIKHGHVSASNVGATHSARAHI